MARNKFRCKQKKIENYGQYLLLGWASPADNTVDTFGKMEKIMTKGLRLETTKSRESVDSELGLIKKLT